MSLGIIRLALEHCKQFDNDSVTGGVRTRHWDKVNFIFLEMGGWTSERFDAADARDRLRRLHANCASRSTLNVLKTGFKRRTCDRKTHAKTSTEFNIRMFCLLLTQFCFPIHCESR